MQTESDKAQTNRHILLSRRHFLYGALGACALSLASDAPALALAAYADEEDLDVLEVPDDSVITQENLVETTDDSMFSLLGSFELPYGTLLWSQEESLAACLFPSETSTPLTSAGILFLASGETLTLLEEALGQDEHFDIYDVRACSEGLIWTEANILAGIWRIYTATFDGTNLGKASLVDQGDNEWETPTLAIAGGKAFWQVLPTAGGIHKTEQSTLKCAAFGSSEVTEVYASLGRMSTPPYPFGDSIVISPRTDTAGVHHQLTLVDAETGQTKDSLVLPQSMKPLEAGYGDTGFTFCFENIYSYGDGIANLGSYTPLAAHEAHDYQNKTWFRFERTPYTAPCWAEGFFIVKSSLSVWVIDFDTKTYCTLSVPDGSDTYGDYLASMGDLPVFVTFANVKRTSVSGEESRHCLVRVWKSSGVSRTSS